MAAIVRATAPGALLARGHICCYPQLDACTVLNLGRFRIGTPHPLADPMNDV
jgi:hypothetical protein